MVKNVHVFVFPGKLLTTFGEERSFVFIFAQAIMLPGTAVFQ